MVFGYLKDPLFLTCFTVYWIHRVVARHELSTPLLQSYLNDVICIPFWIPIMLWAQRRLGLRPHDDPPHGHEIVIPLIVWAVVFEVALPQTRIWGGRAVADPNDVLSYAVGGLIAVGFWTWWYTENSIKSRQESQGDALVLENSPPLGPNCRRSKYQ